ncbi:unnamed protein product [Paramecium pentaurelia]|uniref:WD40-repeat-containing domain n=1 Tax=Paramecium pentaurelia TaxID=43138 RepID=A0A8S1V2D3_9CILI|nr:unnamed protein product [Paramecium pentaurelia]
MSKTEMLNKELKSHMIELEKQLDSSFDKINNLIDQLFIIDTPISNFNNPKFEQSSPKFDQFNLIGLNEFQLDILQEVKPLINQKIKDQVQFELLQLQQNDCILIQQSSQQKEIQQIIKTPSSQFNLKPFTYQMIKHNSIQEQQSCHVIEINKDCSMVAIGCWNQIKIYEFKQGIMKQIQVFYQSIYSVYNLNFMQKSNELISGDLIGSIVIWSGNNNTQWNSSQTIKGHSAYISCLILNNNEDLFITSSFDKTIKFWIQKNEWIWQQTITDHIDNVYSLSLNDQEDKVISCGLDGRVLVIEYSEQSKTWIVIQNIKVDCFGYRLSFINNNLFAFQPRNGNLMYVYEMNSVSKQFTKTKDIIVNQNNDDNYELFPSQFIKQKQILVIKHGEYVNFIRKTEKDEFKVEQSIHFYTNILFGRLSDDGEYLITWDDSSKEIQIRKYKEE